ncbi:MAG: UvrB/UvrC motif-containing protein [Candidatus Eisenbacteria bacterium]
MRCQQCNDAEATVHLKEVTDGKLRELHLCESCANEKGFHPVIEQNKLTIATQFIWMAENLYPETSSKVGAVQCSACGLRYSQFSRVGRVGCPECYDAFQPQLQKILLRVHGATKHKGRLPVDPSSPATAATSTATAESPEVPASGATGGPSGPAGAAPADLSALSPEQLERHVRELEGKLKRAVETEAYEDAARIRDEIRRLRGGAE